MAGTDSEMISQGEVQSSLQQEQQQQQQQQPKNHAFPSLGRQSSIYSLTLDEFQHTICEGGKNFGSMNMDEFLNSIWTAEEHQAQAQGQASSTAPVAANNYNNPVQFSLGESTASADHHKGVARQSSLSRQGSLTLPAPLCRKTVDEVWAEIHKTQQEQQHNNGGNVQNPGSARRQMTFGEMTLEDFLIRAWVVREQGHPPPPSQPQQPYGMYQNGNNPGMGAPFVSRPVMPLGGTGAAAAPGPAGVNVPAAYQPFPHGGVAEASGYAGGMKRAGVYAQQHPVVYGGRVGNGTTGAYGQVQDITMGSPVSPVSSDGLCANQMEGNLYGLDMGGARGSRKRIIDGPIEKVVERRQRRMIKNRESAARSRARKQAYTVELEAELNQLKEENAHLKQALSLIKQAEMERKRKQQYFEEVKIKVQTKAQKANEKLRVMRRTLSFP